LPPRDPAAARAQDGSGVRYLGAVRIRAARAFLPADDSRRGRGLVAAELARDERAYEPELRPIAQAMAAGGWNWAPVALPALGIAEHPRGASRAVAGLDVWRDLPEWAERGPEPPSGDVPVETSEADARLLALLGTRAEARPQQRDFAAAVTHAFTPRDRLDAPKIAIAEAGTGVGKTLGYVAPASVWAEKNAGAVWISTFTRNLQHQID